MIQSIEGSDTEAIGRHNVAPRGLYEKHLHELKQLLRESINPNKRAPRTGRV
jgi:hypothetical protein